MQTVTMDTLNALIKSTEENNTTTVKIGENVNIEVKRFIDIDSFHAICATLAVQPFAETEEGYASYVPSGEVTGFRVAIVRTYTNLELPSDITEAYQLCARLNIFQKVNDVLKNTDQYRHLQEIAAKYSDYHRFASTVTRILDEISDAFENLDMNEVLQNVMSGFTALTSEDENE